MSYEGGTLGKEGQDKVLPVPIIFSHKWTRMQDQKKLEELVDFAKNIDETNYRRFEISQIEFKICGHLQLVALTKQNRDLQPRQWWWMRKR